MNKPYNEQEAPIRAYLTYSLDEELTGAWQNFPTTSEDVEYSLGRVGIKAEYLTGIQDTVYKTTIGTLARRLPYHPDLDELNHLAHRIGELTEYERTVFSAVVEANLHCGSLSELINLTHSLDSFDLYPGGFSERDFGNIMLEMHGEEFVEVMDRLRTSDDPQGKAFANYVERLESSSDLQKYGAIARQEEGGVLTGSGYLIPPGEALPQKYNGPREIPVEHRLTGEPEPKPSLLGQLTAGKEECRAADIERSVAPEKKAPSGPEL